MKDATASAAKWAAGMQNAGTAIQDGVQRVQTAPGLTAAKNKSAYVQNVAAAANKWAARTAAVPLSEWQNAMITKGLPRIATGATAAQPKMQAFLQNFLPFVESAVNALPPRGTLDQNLARANQLARQLATYKKPA